MITRFEHLMIQHTSDRRERVDLSVVESLAGCALPDDFAEFLQAANGAVLYYELATPRAGDLFLMPFHYVLPPGPETSVQWPATIVGCTEHMRELMRIPPYRIEFACHPAGASLYLDVEPRGSGRVLAYSPFLNDDATDEEGEAEFIRIADSFAEYVQLLHLNYRSILDLLQETVQGRDPRRMTEWLNAAVPDWKTRYDVPDDIVARMT